MLNNNKLVTLGKEMLNGLTHLRTLKLADNALACDCHLAWLSRHLRTYPRLGQHTRCASPAPLKDRNLVDLQVSPIETIHTLSMEISKFQISREHAFRVKIVHKHHYVFVFFSILLNLYI